MKRIVWVVGLASWALIGSVAPAFGSPLTLSISGATSEGGISPSDTPGFGPIDVSDGFAGVSTSRTRPIGDASWWPADMRERPYEGYIRLTGYLYDGAERLASVDLHGSVDGSYYRRWGLEHSSINAFFRGTATAGTMEIAPGVDPARIPTWFTGLTATLRGATRDTPGGVTTTLTISAAPVPEPGSVLVFLAAAGGGLVALRRRRD